MLDAIVQFIRNFLCCIKDLDLLSDTWLYDNTILMQYYDFPYPLNKTTPLEVMISIVQFYVVYSGVPSSIYLITGSYGKLNRIYRLLDHAGPIATDTDRLIRASLFKEAVYALRSIFVGINVLCISISFIWLAANSWHITETDYIGGVPALIHALTVMNICLMPLLYYMYKDANEQFQKVSLMKALHNKLQQGIVTEEDIGLTSLEILSSWVPFWDSGVGLFDKVDDKDTENKLFTIEQDRVKVILSDITGETASIKKIDDEKKREILRKIIQYEKAEALQKHINVTKFEGYREYVYLVINTIAWYGYGMCILVYYYNDELKHPDWLRIILLHYSNDNADWYGNFAGDLMWTIEPIIVLLSPFYINYYIRNYNKSKNVQQTSQQTTTTTTTPSEDDNNKAKAD